MREHEREKPLARASPTPTASAGIRRASSAAAGLWKADERLVVEEPLEIRLGGRRFTLTMRTLGHDEELLAGFLPAEGFIETRDDLDEIRRVRGTKGAPQRHRRFTTCSQAISRNLPPSRNKRRSQSISSTGEDTR